MHPVLASIGPVAIFGVTIGPLVIHAYGALMGVAFIAGYVYLVVRGRPRGIDESTAARITLILMVCGLVGARLEFARTNLSQFAGDPGHLFRFERGGMPGGLVFLGGVIGAMLGGAAYVRWRGLSILESFDLFAPPAVLGEGITRIGCFLNGCCCGIPTTSSLGVVFPASIPLGVPRYPTQLFETAIAVGIFVILDRSLRRGLKPGTVVVEACYLYCTSRFLIDFIREESLVEHYLFGLTLGQSESLILLLVAAVFHVWLRTRPDGTGPAGRRRRRRKIA